MILLNEKWKLVPSTNGYYEASTLGRIRRAKLGPKKGATWVGRVLTSVESSIGYLVVPIRFEGVRRLEYVHKLVAETFLGVRPDGYEINHINCERNDPRLLNLEYVTRYGNINHSVRKGKYSKKLTVESVLAIREFRKRGVTLRKIGQQFGVTEQAIWSIVKRKSWRHI